MKFFVGGGGEGTTFYVDDAGNVGSTVITSTAIETACVTTPTN